MIDTPRGGTPMLLHYVLSKGVVIALTRSVAREAGQDGIPGELHRVRADDERGVMAGAGATLDLMRATMMSRCLPRDQMPADLTGTLTFLLSPDSNFITGQTLVAGGDSIMH